MKNTGVSSCEMLWEDVALELSAVIILSAILRLQLIVKHYEIKSLTSSSRDQMAKVGLLKRLASKRKLLKKNNCELSV